MNELCCFVPLAPCGLTKERWTFPLDPSFFRCFHSSRDYSGRTSHPFLERDFWKYLSLQQSTPFALGKSVQRHDCNRNSAQKSSKDPRSQAPRSRQTSDPEHRLGRLLAKSGSMRGQRRGSLRQRPRQVVGGVQPPSASLTRIRSHFYLPGSFVTRRSCPFCFTA